LTVGFGSIWSPSCGDKTLVRVDIKTNQVMATIPVGPADSVWLISDPAGALSRIDPATNKVISTISVPAGSAAPYFFDGSVWVTTPGKNTLARVDPLSRTTVAIPVGPKPRFRTAGAGSIWTLNQGNGTVTRVDAKTNQVLASIEVGVLGSGGEIAYGLDQIWVTAFTIPLSEIDPATNRVIRQWTGAGGDSVRAGHVSLWLSNLREQNLWRIDPSKF
jgi:virginiamycin B lyase